MSADLSSDVESVFDQLLKDWNRAQKQLIKMRPSRRRASWNRSSEPGWSGSSGSRTPAASRDASTEGDDNR